MCTQAAGAAGWWRLREASLLAVGAVSEPLLEAPGASDADFNLGAFLDQVLAQDLQNPSSPPFLVGRALWVASRCGPHFHLTLEWLTCSLEEVCSMGGLEPGRGTLSLQRAVRLRTCLLPTLEQSRSLETGCCSSWYSSPCRSQHTHESQHETMRSLNHQRCLNRTLACLHQPPLGLCAKVSRRWVRGWVSCGRCRLAPALSGERLVHYLRGAVEALGSSSIGPVQVGACRAVASLLPRAPAPALQTLLDPIYEGTPFPSP